jgi:predicted protein tyrosine phosphatase
VTPIKILAVCSGNRCRSVSLAAMANATPGVEARSAGTYPVLGGRAICKDDLRWATYVCVFEDQHVRTIRSRFTRLAKKLRIINLDVPDRYAPLDRALLPILQALVKQRIGLDLHCPPLEEIEAAARHEAQLWGQLCGEDD